MTITPLEPDDSFGGPPAPNERVSTAFDQALSGAVSALGRADQSESAFTSGRGSLLAMVLDRAQADIVLNVAAAAASRTAAALNTMFNLQV